MQQQLHNTSDAAGGQFATSRLPTITTQADLDSSMASSSRIGSSPLSSQPGTPSRVQGPHGPHGSHGSHGADGFTGYKERALLDSPGPSNGASSDSPSSSSSWADSVPSLEHRVGPRIAELQSQGAHGSHGSHDSTQQSQARPSGGGVMLLSEVDVDRAQHGAGHLQAAPSSQVLLTSGRTVTITGNVSVFYRFSCYL